MRMRKKPLHGETYRCLSDGLVVTALERKSKALVNVIFPNGKIGSIAIGDLDLPVIDTAFYEKLSESKT